MSGTFALACLAGLPAQAADYTAVKPYAVAVSPDYVIQPLLSVGDQVPNTSDPTKTYQMIGIPDGLGATKGRGNTTVLYMNHELGNTVHLRAERRRTAQSRRLRLALHPRQERPRRLGRACLQHRA